MNNNTKNHRKGGMQESLCPKSFWEWDTDFAAQIGGDEPSHCRDGFSSSHPRANTKKPPQGWFFRIGAGSGIRTHVAFGQTVFKTF